MVCDFYEFGLLSIVQILLAVVNLFPNPLKEMDKLLKTLPIWSRRILPGYRQF